MSDMRNRIYIAVALILSVLCGVSCDREQILKPAGQNDGMTIVASMEIPDASKTSVSSDGVVTWDAGDAFALMTATSKSRFTIYEGAGTSMGSFSGSPISGEGPFYGFYPYSDNCSMDAAGLHFTLPQTQACRASNIAAGASPAIAMLPTLEDATFFRNLCGILSITVKGSYEIGRIAIIDLAGNNLWGDCTLALDGKEGTPDQTMAVEGGSNTIYLDMDKPQSVTTSKTFYAVVPTGSFSGGFSVVIYDGEGRAGTFLTAQNSEVKILRSNITAMNSVTLPNNGEPKDVLARGYYKEVFMDGGVNVTSRTTLPAAPFLGWELEYLATETQSIQDEVILGTAGDPNGALLYPDNEPRFRMIYVNGGQSNKHGKALGETGRSRLITFVTNGGGYVGTCAGALIASMGYDSYPETEEYLHIWPGHVYHTGLSNTATDLTVEKGSALLNYYDFDGDMHIDSVRHNGGCYMDETNYPVPEGTEVLLRYDCVGKKPHGKPNCWAYKPNEFEGRRVLTGSHPEAMENGERRQMMAGMMRYATDGNGIATVKGELINGEPRVMGDGTDPDYAGIGDGQYHHFKVVVPKEASGIRVSLTSSYSGNLHLALRKGDMAWRSEADYVLVQKGSTKSLSIPDLEEGEWYVSVYCPDKPVSTLTKSGENSYFKYSGSVEPLKGVPYTISVEWEDSSAPIPSNGTEKYPIVVL